MLFYFTFIFYAPPCALSDGTPSSARHPAAFPKQTEEISHDQQIAGCLLLLTEEQTAQTVYVQLRPCCSKLIIIHCENIMFYFLLVSVINNRIFLHKSQLSVN